MFALIVPRFSASRALGKPCLQKSVSHPNERGMPRDFAPMNSANWSRNDAELKLDVEILCDPRDVQTDSYEQFEYKETECAYDHSRREVSQMREDVGNKGDNLYQRDRASQNPGQCKCVDAHHYWSSPVFVCRSKDLLLFSKSLPENIFLGGGSYDLSSLRVHSMWECQAQPCKKLWRT